MKLNAKLGPEVFLSGPTDDETEMLLHTMANAIKHWALNRGYVILPDAVHILSKEPYDSLAVLDASLDPECEEKTVVVSLPLLSFHAIDLEEEEAEEDEN